MTICSCIKTSYCLNSCCYFSKKQVSEKEALSLGLESIIKLGSNYYLKNKTESFSACTFLDEEKGACNIHDKRPSVCRIYDCYNDGRIEYLFQEVRHYLKKRRGKHEILIKY